LQRDKQLVQPQKRKENLLQSSTKKHVHMWQLQLLLPEEVLAVGIAGFCTTGVRRIPTH
jgi:hypothetical protein